MTPEKQEEYLEHLAAGSSRQQAAALVGVTEETARSYRRLHHEFAAEVEKAEVEALEAALIKHALQGDVQCLMFYLTNRKPNYWKQGGKYGK